MVMNLCQPCNHRHKHALTQVVLAELYDNMLQGERDKSVTVVRSL